MNDTDILVEAHLKTMRAKRGRRFIHAGGRGMTVRTPGDHVLYLPNGDHIRVTTDDSGVATQVEQDERLHAVVRPHTIHITPRR
jgi:hypothetical protein